MQTEATISNGVSITKPQLVQEIYGGELYEYYPLGQYIVAAPGVCGGRPTFKYTRLEVSMILALLANGETISAPTPPRPAAALHRPAGAHIFSALFHPCRGH